MSPCVYACLDAYVCMSGFFICKLQMLQIFSQDYKLWVGEQPIKRSKKKKKKAYQQKQQCDFVILKQQLGA